MADDDDQRLLEVETMSYDVELFLVQEFRDGPQAMDKERLRAVLDDGARAHLIVLSELRRPVAEECKELLSETARLRRQFIICPWGIGRSEGRYENLVYVFGPDGVAQPQAKISLCASDLAWRPADWQPSEGGAEASVLVPGGRVHVFAAGHFRFAVLNCHDYTHADLLRELVTEDLDVLVVAAANEATQMFAEYAMSDLHRLFAYVVLSNTGEMGGSGVYAPFHSRLDASGALSMGGVQFAARGRAQARARISLAISQIRDMRRRYRTSDPDDPSTARLLEEDYRSIAPPETVTYSRPPYRGVIEAIEGNPRPSGSPPMGVRTIAVAAPTGERGGTWKVGVAQIRGLSVADYKATWYCISRAGPPADQLAARVRQIVEQHSRDLDLLVFPEVSVPIHALVENRPLDQHLRQIADDHGIIIVAGVEYDPPPDGVTFDDQSAHGQNRVRVYLPKSEPVDYAKGPRVNKSMPIATLAAAG